MEIKGKVIQSLGVQSGTSKLGREWTKATIVVETEGQYPKKVALDNLKNAESFANIPIGSMGVFYIEVESREHNGRWFTSVNCYKWETEQILQQQPSSQPAEQQGWQSAYPPAQPKAQTAIDNNAAGDLPF